MFCEIPEFGRCCFCMPLRRGILVFGYLNILFSAFMVGLYSFSIHYDFRMPILYHGVTGALEEGFCLAIYCIDIIFNLVLLYGAHRQILIYLKVFYYYTLSTLFAVVVMEIFFSITTGSFNMFELITLFFIGLCIHLYLVFLVRSLIKKMEISGHAYENQLHQFVNGEVKVGDNSVYPSTVVPAETA